MECTCTGSRCTICIDVEKDVASKQVIEVLTLSVDQMKQVIEVLTLSVDQIKQVIEVLTLSVDQMKQVIEVLTLSVDQVVYPLRKVPRITNDKLGLIVGGKLKLGS